MGHAKTMQVQHNSSLCLGVKHKSDFPCWKFQLGIILKNNCPVQNRLVPGALLLVVVYILYVWPLPPRKVLTEPFGTRLNVGQCLFTFWLAAPNNLDNEIQFALLVWESFSLHCHHWCLLYIKCGPKLFEPTVCRIRHTVYSYWILNVKRIPAMSMLIEGLP